MSKLLEHIREYQTGNHLTQLPMMTFSDTIHENKINPKYVIEYECKLEIGGYCYAVDAKDLQYQKQNIRRKIATEVFGEFRTPLLELHSAISKGDRQEAMRLVNFIYEAMFSD